MKTILLVEDNPYDIELTIRAFSASQLETQIVVVRDGEEALDYLLYRGTYEKRPLAQPAVVLLDINMPRLSGLQVLQNIRQHERLRWIPVVMLTTSREETDLRSCYSLGANAYVVKPVAYADFVKAARDLGVFWGGLNEAPSS